MLSEMHKQAPTPVFDKELVYLAGFFDGEGCVSFGYTNGRPGEAKRPWCMASVGNTDLRPLELYKKRFAGSICLTGTHLRRPNNKPLFQWHVSGKQLDLFLLSMTPFLIIKADKVDQAKEFRKAAFARPRARRGGLPRVKLGHRPNEGVLDTEEGLETVGDLLKLVVG
jgi:hypothetical protein